jgi:hypothetical protein
MPWIPHHWEEFWCLRALYSFFKIEVLAEEYSWLVLGLKPVTCIPRCREKENLTFLVTKVSTKTSYNGRCISNWKEELDAAQIGQSHTNPVLSLGLGKQAVLGKAEGELICGHRD